MKPLFEGYAEVEMRFGHVTVAPPKDVVIPPGYTMETAVHLPSSEFPAEKPMATYRVIPTKGIKAAYLRWRYPYRP